MSVPATPGNSDCGVLPVCAAVGSGSTDRLASGSEQRSRRSPGSGGCRLLCYQEGLQGPCWIRLWL